jgi:uncharacterized protein with FMN-binding domain
MRRAVIVLGTTAAGIAALFSYKTHVAGVAVASTSPATPTMTAGPMTSPTASTRASASPSKSAAKSTPKPSSSATAPRTAPSRSTTPAPSKKPTPAPTTAAPSSSAPAGKSGTFTGQAVNTQYGEVQVSITVSNGKITNADGTLPQGGDSIGQNAIPQLNQEVLTAQSANIQAVSGATYTSQGYISSLQQAVDQAGL